MDNAPIVTEDIKGKIKVRDIQCLFLFFLTSFLKVGGGGGINFTKWARLKK